jgi:hypothetical protein
MKSRVFAAMAIFGLFALPACGGGGNSSPVPTGTTCPNIVAQAQLLYPVPGSTAVPDNVASIAIAVSSPLVSDVYNIAFANSGGLLGYSNNYLVQITANQLPSGSATTTITNPTYMSAQLTGLPSATAFTAIGINNPATNCIPQTISGATFTTQ